MASRDDAEQLAEVVRFARRVYELIRAWEAANPHKTFKIDSKVSRLLALVPEYDSGRIRKREPSRGPARAPTIFTAKELGDRLGVPLCALFESKDHRVFSHSQIEGIRKALRALLQTFSHVAISPSNDFDDPVPFETIRQPAFDFAAGRSGIDGDFAPETYDVFRGVRGIGSERFAVIRINGDSMRPLLLPGDRVLIDTSLTRPHNGDVVAVFGATLGRVIGYWRITRGECFLAKENRDHSRIVLQDPEDWCLLGTITGFVDAPLRPRDRLPGFSLA